VLLTGFGSGGQQVYLTADAWQAAVKAVAPGLQVFKALPVDGLRPNLRQTLFCTAGMSMSLQPNVFVACQCGWCAETIRTVAMLWHEQQSKNSVQI
jgi:hypothetical protein